MGLRFDPVGGGQLKAAVKAIIEAESQPIKQMEARKVREETRMKLFGEFKGKFSGLEKAIAEVSDFKRLRELKTDFGDGATLMTATVDKEKAQPGSYSIEINQLAARTSIISNGFKDPDEANLGMGFVVMNLANGDTAEVYVEEAQASLRGIASAINNQPGSAVRAAVVRDASDQDTPWRLIVTAKAEGDENQIEFPDFYFMDGDQDLYIDDNRDAQNARLKLDGFEIELQGNDVTEFLPGVNVHLKQARPDQPFTLSISEDYQKVTGKVKALVEQINGVLGFINKQNQIDEKSDTRTTFAGDTSLQSIEYRIRNLMHEGFPIGNPNSDNFRLAFLTEFGVEFDKAGNLTMKEEKFTKVSESDFEGVSEAISGPMGFAYQLHELLKGFTSPIDGVLKNRERGMRTRIQEIDRQIENKTRNVERRQQALTEQFARLQSTLSNMQRQQQALSATMPSGGGGNIVSQLLGG